ncbi:MAG: RNA 2'-phosphotransferase [Proteobacteria bacterium]|nr:RNA 2'-phosphotransferase [Pseudomonadota bacterium]
MQQRTRISKTLSLWLRHRPGEADLLLTPSGWAEVEEVLSALKRKGLEVGQDDLADLVARCDKQRFELSKDGGRIRARQGHTLPIQGDWTPADPPHRLYHGTVDRLLEPILREGLLPIARHHVHLSRDEETARRVGSRRGAPVVLQIKAGELAASGRSFYLTGNGVWLTDHVPPEYLSPLPA